MTENAGRPDCVCVLLELPLERQLSQSSHDFELRALKRALPWTPLVGVALVLAVHFCGGYFVNLGTIPTRHVWSDVLSLRSFVLLVAPTCAAAAWWCVLCWESGLRSREGTSLPIAAPVTVLLICGMGWLVSLGFPQWAFLQSVWIRSDPYSLERSMANWKLDLEGNKSSTVEGMSIVGSSQISFAVDELTLQNAFPDIKVWNNVLPGFGILQYLMALPTLKDQHATTVICLLSEFDTFRDERLPIERMRYFGRWREKFELIALMPWPLVWSNRSELADLLAANLSPFWRDRDMYRLLIESAWWTPHATAPSTDEGHSQTDTITAHGIALRRSLGKTSMTDLNFAAFEKFADLLRRQDVNLWVFEGMIHPRAMALYDPEGRLRLETRKRFSAMAENTGFTYVTDSDMPLFLEADFADALHLNAEARERFTRYLTMKLCPKGCGEVVKSVGSRDG